MIGDVLKELRSSAHMTQSELSGLLGVKRSTYAYYELNKVMPPLATISKLSVIYRVSVDAILSDNPSIVLNDADAPKEEKNDTVLLGQLTKAERELIIRLRLSGDASLTKGLIDSITDRSTKSIPYKED